ncbi:hypothetical protein U14_02117 [Candidatus Moduliflexus flocculans]|uniref:DUF433 domain-containing protein n=1 Tax=Candidatus Moduliflexus flocculans TaxID=1499966 RepID=A0A0S6VY39_9BACT|nr:hypothetical protein U14_02117 [Candidatus Moduliflexus flocculans]
MIQRFEPQQPLLERITVNPRVMVGKPTIRGLRITVDQILRALAAGVTHQEILADYPNLESDDIYAVLLYAAELVSEEQVFPIEVAA